MKKLFILLAFVGAGFRAHAVKPVIGANAFYFTDDFTYGSGSPSQYKRIMFDLTAGIPLTKKGSVVLGWSYGSYSFTETTTTETSLKVADMGPKLTYYLDKARTWETSLTYNLISKGTYAGAGAAETELRGTSLKFEAGYMPQMWENVFMGAKINYYKASFKEEITGQTALAQVTHSRAVIYPTFAVTFRWD